MNKSLLSFLLLLSFHFSFSQNFTVPQKLGQLTNSEIDAALEELRYDSVISMSEKENSLYYLKSMSKQIGYKLGEIESGLRILELYKDQNENKKIIELATQLKKIPNDEKSYRMMSNIYRINALALGYLGFDEISRKDFKKAIYYAEKIKDSDIRNFTLSLCYQNFTLYFFNKRLENETFRDSVAYHLNQSLITGELVGDSNTEISLQQKFNHIAFAHVRFAIHYLEQPDKPGHIQLAEKHLFEGLSIVNKYNLVNADKVVLLNQLSWLFLEKKDYLKTIEYANLAWNLEKQFNDPTNRVESFEFLASAYSELGNKEKAKFYLNKYTYLKDSIRISEKNEADQSFNILLSDSKQIQKKKSKLNLLIISSISLFLLLVLAIYWKRKNKIIHKKYEELILKVKTKKNPEENSSNGIQNKNENKLSVNITDETAEKLLRKLEKFEQSDKYLRKDINLTSLATNLKTNTKYLSETIKIHREKTFADYINGLRINYITHKLVNDPIYREYKVNYLAEECGYNSPQVFVISFKKETGFTPSYFIDQLKKEEVAGN